jgi:lactoylglutathione lyase
MHIEHIALWMADLERMIAFYERYFEARAGEVYYNPGRQFRPCFLSFASGVRLELMSASGIGGGGEGMPGLRIGYTRLAIAMGSRDTVNELTARLQADGYSVLDGLRHTEDGYYESVVLDPDGNRIELTV